jgi:hypothetical protein
MTIAKCINGNCGYEFNDDDYEETGIFFDTVPGNPVHEDDDILFRIENSTGGCLGLCFCPVCGSKCIELEED